MGSLTYTSYADATDDSAVCGRKLMSNHVGQRRSDAHSTVNRKNQLHVGHDGLRFQRPLRL